MNEYMSEGSLRDHLRDKSDSKRYLDDKPNHAKSLSWQQRLSIALDAAQGLEYLHDGCYPPIVHRDIKPGNILLNGNLEAKLADFGLSRAFDNRNMSHLSTLVAGTLGYLDPMYHRTGQLTVSTDVYSFGVVLLQLITGLPAIVVGGLERCHIGEWVKMRLADSDISELVDPRLQEHYETNTVWKVHDVAMRCLLPDHSERARIADVVVELKEALDLLLASKRPKGNSDRLADQKSLIDIDIEMDSMVSGPSAR